VNPLVKEILDRSLLGAQKLQNLQDIAAYVLSKNLEGDVAECGVYKGGSAKVIASVFDSKKVFLFDSFSGMREDDVFLEGHKRGDFSDTNIEDVKRFLSDRPNCLFFQGWLPDSAAFINRQQKFCFVHVDLDLYESTLSAVSIFWPRLVVGGVMVFDDWDWQRCPGVKKAVEEYFDSDSSRVPHVKEIRSNVCAILKL
jgi:hypothetical protein